MFKAGLCQHSKFEAILDYNETLSQKKIKINKQYKERENRGEEKREKEERAFVKTKTIIAILILDKTGVW